MHDKQKFPQETQEELFENVPAGQAQAPEVNSKVSIHDSHEELPVQERQLAPHIEHEEP